MYYPEGMVQTFTILDPSQLRFLDLRMHISLRYGYLPILVGYNNKFGTSMLYEQP